MQTGGSGPVVPAYFSGGGPWSCMSQPETGTNHGYLPSYQDICELNLRRRVRSFGIR
jgi:hypothetical protein